MSTARSLRKQSGFTLVELLIVAIILAILAAIIIPQFAATTVDAQESALRANAAAMRSSINLYRQQHAGVNAGSNLSSGGLLCGGTVGAGAALSDTAFIDQLTRYSNAAGQTCSMSSANYPFGPYIQDDELPANSVTDDNTLVVVNVGNLIMAADGPGGGWKFDATTGKFIVNDDGTDSQGALYTTY